MRKIALLLTFIVLALGAPIIGAQEETPEPESPPAEGERESVMVTVYNQGTALIKDRRTFNLEEGVTLVNFTDVASTIDATSVNFKSLTDPENTYVLEQNYVFDLVDSNALVKRYIDETIQVTTADGTVYVGQLLSGNGGIILRTESGEVVVISPDDVLDLKFPELPEGLITRPTLRWLVQAAEDGPQQVELTYLAGGMSWTADYTIVLGQENTNLDLNGWVTVNNTSGTAYQDAQLKLVAGDVNRVANNVAPPVYADGVVMSQAAAPAPVEQREFFEYQLYEIPRPVTIGNNETKQVEFVSGADVPANTFFVYDASTPFYGYGYAIYDQYYGNTSIMTVGSYLEFSTAEDGGLGADLPAGRIRVYQEDVDGAALLIGENRINHTPEGEDVQIYLGNAFDLVGERIQTDFRLISSNVLQETYEIRLRNRKDDETVEIRVPERLFRWSNWEILSSSHDYEKTQAHAMEFRVEVPPQGETVITYTVQYTFPE